jgi:hypothetical protein
MRRIVKEEDIGLSEGCQYLQVAKKDIEKLQNKKLVFNKKIDAEILKKQEWYKQLENEGFCLIDKPKIIPNPMTGKILSKKMVHQDNCISKGEQ